MISENRFCIKLCKRFILNMLLSLLSLAPKGGDIRLLEIHCRILICLLYLYVCENSLNMFLIPNTRQMAIRARGGWVVSGKIGSRPDPPPAPSLEQTRNGWIAGGVRDPPGNKQTNKHTNKHTNKQTWLPSRSPFQTHPGIEIFRSAPPRSDLYVCKTLLHVYPTLQ